MEIQCHKTIKYSINHIMIIYPINPDTTSFVQSLLKNIDLKFLFYFDVWNQNLGQVYRATKILQVKT